MVIEPRQRLYTFHSAPVFCIRPFVPLSTLHTIFYPLIQPHFDYCSVVWGKCNKTLAAKLQKLQNRSARILTFSSYDTNAGCLLEGLG